MDIALVREFLGWCVAINLGVLVYWALFLKFARSMVYEIHSKFMNLSEEQFSLAQYQAMAFYKLSIIMLFLVPYLVLKLMA